MVRTPPALTGRAGVSSRPTANGGNVAIGSNRVVARYRNGRLVKGTTADFLPTRDHFHVQTETGEVLTVPHAELKALFFVRGFKGDPQHRSRNQFDPAKPVPGRKIRVVFTDGEVLVGTTQGYDPHRAGFFVVPADTESNTERCFVLAAATREVQLL